MQKGAVESLGRSPLKQTGGMTREHVKLEVVRPARGAAPAKETRAEELPPIFHNCPL